MSFKADLQLQSHYSGGTSKSMTPLNLVEGAIKKGLDVIGTSDIHHKEWRDELKRFVQENGCLDELKVIHKDKEIFFIPQTEVEIKRVHFVVLLPDLNSAEKFQKALEGKFKFYSGRPILDLKFKEFQNLIKKLDGLFGPAHAFTPYYGIYAYFDKITEIIEPDFLELGLSADTYLANLIDELNEPNKIPFLSNSDAHSPYPHRLGREFNVFKGKYSFDKLGEFKIELNCGLNPEEGKYHLTACVRCKQRFTLKQAKKFNWRCPLCNGSIKKGVRDRILELAGLENLDNEEIEEIKIKKMKETKRPKYLHILPLTEIISYLVKKGVTTKTVLGKYNELINLFGNEIELLLNVPIQKIKREWEELAIAIEKMREGKIVYFPGGGGEYGRYFIPFSEEEYEDFTKKKKSLFYKEEQEKGKLNYWLKKK